MNKLPKKLIHYSNKIIPKLQKKKYKIPEERIHGGLNFFKPYGFWFSVEDFDDDWTRKGWCEAEKFRLEHLNFEHELKLKKNANILWLKTAQEVIEFSLKWGLELSTQVTKFSEEPYIYRINWEKIQNQWDGIIIAPYVSSLRLSLVAAWYYPWDCASGCVWNMESIKSFKFLRQRDQLYEQERVVL